MDHGLVWFGLQSYGLNLDTLGIGVSIGGGGIGGGMFPFIIVVPLCPGRLGGGPVSGW